MLLHNKFKIENWKYYLLLILIALIEYWSLTLNIFSLKNDAITYFLPWRYQVSQSIQNGYFPFWSPYLYTGLPLHADIQSGVWNPVVLLISLFTKYDMNILQWETLFYIIIGTIGFFKLCRSFAFDKKICLLLSASYMCCGFIIDSGSFIPWITSAAYIPYVFLYFLQIKNKHSISNTIKLSLSVSLLFLAGYTSFFIFTFYILFFISIVYLIFCFKNRANRQAFLFIKDVLITALCTIIICSPAIISYVQFLPYYSRGKGMSLASAQFNPFIFTNSLSFFFPTASYKLITANDISSRNSYFGIIPLIFLVYSLKKKFNSYQKIILTTIILCFLFSLGNATPIRGIFYYALPFMNSFRHPATIRLFTTIGLLLLAGFGLEQYYKKQDDVFYKKLCFALMIVCGAVIIYYGLLDKGFFQLKKIIGAISLNGTSIKTFLDSSSFAIWMIILSLIQLIFLLITRQFAQQKKLFLIAVSSIVNVIATGFLCMPFTLLTQHKTKEVNDFIHSFSQGFPLNEATMKVENQINDSSSFTTFGYKNFYQKNISIQDYVVSPTVNTAYRQMLNDSLIRKSVSQHSFVYCDSNKLSVTRFSPNSFSLSINNSAPDVLHITQQYNPNWKAFINGHVLFIEKDNIAFMKVKIPAGAYTVEFNYKPFSIIVTAIVSLIMVLFCIGVLVYSIFISNEFP